MPRLTIDNRSIEVPEGTKVIDAAERLGIVIPRFCYHPALGSLGACRMCAVKFEEGPVKGIEMSCMVDARDGMVVSTTDAEAVDFRRWIIECLMMNHPHDCPVCDEGGHCLLQDETISGGHGTRFYEGPKRTYGDQYLGEFVQHEMNRCIHCWRCTRFYREFAGFRDLGAMQSGNRTYFGRQSDGPLESPFSGNLIDICPTGVYTDRPARFRGRRWNFERAPSLCIHCSLGCSTTGSARYREMVRQEARYSEAVNGYFICDRGRFGFDFANHPDRPRAARVEGTEVPWEDGIRAAAASLARIAAQDGPDAVACLGSARSSLETQASLKRMCRLLEWPDPSFFPFPPAGRKVASAVAGLDDQRVISLRGLESADFILAVGADPVNEAPMAALAMRQAHRKGALVAVVDPRPVSLPFPFLHFPVPPGALERCAEAIARFALAPGAPGRPGEVSDRYRQFLNGIFPRQPELEGRLNRAAKGLGNSRNPVLVCGTDVVPDGTPAFAADLTRLLRETGKEARLFYLLPGPNAFGAGLLDPGKGNGSVLERVESGTVRALVLVEQDPIRRLPDRRRWEKALARLDLLLVLDYLPSPCAAGAHVLLPTATLFERSPSSFVNQEGRVRWAAPVHRGGAPISQIAGGSHPPRTFVDRVPGGDPKPGHEVLDDLYSALSGKEERALLTGLWDWLAETDPAFEPLRSPATGPEGVRLSLGGRPGTPSPSPAGPEDAAREGGMELLWVEWTFGTEELSSYSGHLRKAEPPPRLLMHPQDASRLGLSEGDRVSIALEAGELAADVGVAATMAGGLLIVPKHRGIGGSAIGGLPARITDDRIRKIPA